MLMTIHGLRACIHVPMVRSKYADNLSTSGTNVEEANASTPVTKSSTNFENEARSLVCSISLEVWVFVHEKETGTFKVPSHILSE
jgi:hypothetical protein